MLLHARRLHTQSNRVPFLFYTMPHKAKVRQGITASSGKVKIMLARCSDMASDHNVKLAGHFRNLARQCPMTDCYFQHCMYRH